jgi:hypothetical protein
MSAFKDAFEKELSKPEVRAAVTHFEHLAMEAAKNALEELVPPFLRPIVQGLVDGLAEQGITAAEHWTDEKLKGLNVVHVKTASGTIALSYIPTPTSDQVKTVADLPAEAKP